MGALEILFIIIIIIIPQIHEFWKVLALTQKRPARNHKNVPVPQRGMVLTIPNLKHLDS